MEIAGGKVTWAAEEVNKNAKLPGKVATLDNGTDGGDLDVSHRVGAKAHGIALGIANHSEKEK